MSYTKTNWENLPSTNTPVNASNLNKIENELEKLAGQRIQTVRIASNESINANEDLNINFAYSPSKANCCVVGYAIAGSYSTRLAPCRICFENDNIEFVARNFDSTNRAYGITIDVYVLEFD